MQSLRSLHSGRYQLRQYPQDAPVRLPSDSPGLEPEELMVEMVAMGRGYSWSDGEKCVAQGTVLEARLVQCASIGAGFG